MKAPPHRGFVVLSSPSGDCRSRSDRDGRKDDDDFLVRTNSGDDDRNVTQRFIASRAQPRRGLVRQLSGEFFLRSGPRPLIKSGRTPPNADEPDEAPITTTHQGSARSSRSIISSASPQSNTARSLSYNTSMSSATSGRGNGLEEASNLDSQRPFPEGSKHSNSLYLPASLTLPSNPETLQRPHTTTFSLSPLKRSQTQHDSATSNRCGCSLLRHIPLPSQSTLYSYSPQQAQYSLTTVSGGYNYPNQQQTQQRSYNPSTYQQTHNRAHSNPENPKPPSPPTLNRCLPALWATRFIRHLDLPDRTLPRSQFPVAFSRHSVAGKGPK
jgi:hypothetical protein